MTKAAQVSSDVVARECDVLIIGAGMAGSCLARQLKLRIPELDIVVVDRKTTFDYWVGESTVEVWEDYMTRILDLGPYLERHHLQKNGLRFFFASPEKDLPVAPIRGLVEFCAHIPLVYTPCAEGEPSITA